MKILNRKIIAAALALCMTLMSAGTAFAGAWINQSPEGTSKWWYREDNGTWPADTWKEIEGVWYYFNPDGYMATGWKYSAGSDSWYYLDASGAMAANRSYEEGYLDSTGAWYNNVPAPTSAYTATAEQKEYWTEQFAKYGLTDNSCTDNGDGTYTWSLIYDDSTEIPNMYYTLLTKLVFTYNGMYGDWKMANHIFTVTVKPRQLYPTSMDSIVSDTPGAETADPSAPDGPVTEGPPVASETDDSVSFAPPEAELPGAPN